MPVLSSAAKQIQYEHVMTQLLQRDLRSSPIAMALEAHFGVGNSTHKDVDNIVSMTEDDIASLGYEIEEHYAILLKEGVLECEKDFFC